MKAREFISELFTPGKGFKIEWDPDYDEHAIAHDNQGRAIDISIVNMGRGVVEIDFSRGGSQEVTGAGDSVAVFGAVVEAVRQYLAKHSNVKYIVFAPSDLSPSRFSLYQALVNRLGPRAGFTQISVEDAPEEVTRGLKMHPKTFVLQRIMR